MLCCDMHTKNLLDIKYWNVQKKQAIQNDAQKNELYASSQHQTSWPSKLLSQGRHFFTTYDKPYSRHQDKTDLNCWQLCLLHDKTGSATRYIDALLK